VEEYTDISRGVLREKIQDREENFTLIEVLPKGEYERAHLPDAINIQLDDLSVMVPRLVPNLWEDLVVYGSGPDSDASERAARVLVGLGYKDVKRYAGGKTDWIDAGLPVESDERLSGRVA
jgi:rhodanese-related sulfurtransferase